MNIITALIIFSIIVTIHELGHFLFAKVTGVKVLEFSVGMGPRILSFKGKETIYSLKLLPIGGSCSMLGEDELVEEDTKESEGAAAAAGSDNVAVMQGAAVCSDNGAVMQGAAVCSDNGAVMQGAAASSDNGAVMQGDAASSDNGAVMQGDAVGSDNGAVMHKDSGTSDKGRKFSDKGALQRFIIVFGGPLFNFILAFIVSILLIAKTGVDLPVVRATLPDYPAAQSGILEGDLIESIDNKKVYLTRDFITYLYFNNKDSHQIKVKRGDESLTFDVKTVYSEAAGRNITGLQLETSQKINGAEDIIKYSAYEVVFNIKNTLTSLKYMILGKIGAGQISGPVGIVSVIGETINESSTYGFEAVLLSIASLVVLLSANLGIMNLLPVPALDGGRILFILAELISGKKINKKFEALVHVAGFIFLMLLMVFLIFNDIRKLI